MAQAKLTIDLDAIVDNWRRLDQLSSAAATAAVVKANGYGLGAVAISRALMRAGVRSFFVALAEEGKALRDALGNGPEIFILSGYADADGPLVADAKLIPVLNSTEQFRSYLAAFPGGPIALQIDTGMNRLGMEAADFCAVRDQLGSTRPELVISHLACADCPEDALNARQLRLFADLTTGMDTRRSLASTGGILLGSEYHFDLCRPGIGLYGGLPFADARNVVRLDVPVIQVREVLPGEIVGYGAEWTAGVPTRVATIGAGYADGIFRLLGNNVIFHAEGVACQTVGRISMDLITVDVSHLGQVPDSLQLLGDHQTINELADRAATICNEVLTNLGSRYERVHICGN